MTSKTMTDNAETTKQTKEENVSFFDSIKDKYHDIMDQQRLERLKSCRELELALQNDNFESRGIIAQRRMDRYFGFNNDESSEGDARIKAQHALWACRAVSLGCADKLVELKECFQEQNSSPLTEATAYEGSLPQKAKPCQELQQLLGTCVRKNAAELEKRRNKSS